MRNLFILLILLFFGFADNNIESYKKLAEDKTDILKYKKASHSLAMYYINKNLDYKKAIYHINNILNTKEIEGFNFPDYLYKEILGSIYLSGGYGIEQDYKKAYEYTKESAKYDKKGATCNLGYIYEKGFYVKKDLKKAYELYKVSANNGYELCEHNMGVYYYDGVAVKQDYKKAYEWFSKSYDLTTKKGHFKSAGYLIKMKCEGLGTKKDTSFCPSPNTNVDMKVSVEEINNSLHNANVHMNMYNFYRNSNNPDNDKMIYHLEELLKIKKHPDYERIEGSASLMLAGLYIKKNNLEKAVEYLKVAEKKDLGGAILQLMFIYKNYPNLQKDKNELKRLDEKCKKNNKCVELLNAL